MYVRVYKEECAAWECARKQEKKRYAGPEADGLSQSLSMWMEQRTFCASFFFSFSFSKIFKMAVLAPPPSACVHNSLRCKKRKKFRLPQTTMDMNRHTHLFLLLYIPSGFLFYVWYHFFPLFSVSPSFSGTLAGMWERERGKKKVKKDILKGYGEKAPTVIECASGTEKEKLLF